MNYTSRVCIREGIADLQSDFDRAINRDLPLDVKDIPESLALQELHCDKVSALVLAGFVYGNYVRMGQ